MILDGYTYTKIMEGLQISERTLYRYLDITFSEEKDLLEETLGGSREEMRRQILICRDRLLEDRRTLQEWLKDPNFKDKINAMHLSAELAAAILRLYNDGPAHLSNRHAFPRYNSLREEQQGPDGTTTCARFVPKKQQQQEPPLPLQQKKKRKRKNMMS